MKHSKKQRSLARTKGASDDKVGALPPVGSVLSALTASAMALPGLAPSAAADSPVEVTTVDVDASYYREDKLRPKKTVFGAERDRMEIQSYSFRIATPLTERADLETKGTFETLSGASPWFVLPDIAGDRGGRPIQVMSESTIDETRGDLLATGNYFFDQGKLSASSGFSLESDYYSANLGFGGERSFNDKNTTLSAGGGFSYDWIKPTDCKEFNRVCSEDKRNYTVFAGFSQVITRHSALQSTFSFGYSEGYLSDPYKQAYIDTVGGQIERDARPDKRKQYTWLTKYRHHVSALEGTLHVDYRLYADDWSINSHTFDIAWFQSVPWQIQIIPSFRYYSQSQADFYEVFYQQAQSDGLYSSDFRLSPYGAIAYRLKVTKDVEDWPGKLDWQLALSYERYEQSAGLAFESVKIENPGLVAFNLFAVRLTVKF